MTELLWAIILGIIEGVTEFLPISSTGHLLLAERWMNVPLEEDPFWKMFAIFIQIGAILAVVVYFRARIVDLVRKSLWPNHPADTGTLIDSSANGHPATATAAPPRARVGPSPLAAVIVGTVPVLVAGLLLHSWVEAHMERPLPIALALGIGGVIMLLLERFRPAPRTHRLEEMSWGQAIGVGTIQILAAVFPGTSRSAATIIGGLGVGMSREVAAEFSFFLAIPAMFAACGYSLLKHSTALTVQRWMLLAVGTLVSFLVAWAVIAAFMSYIRRHNFVPFAVYRVVLAAVVLWALL